MLIKALAIFAGIMAASHANAETPSHLRPIGFAVIDQIDVNFTKADFDKLSPLTSQWEFPADNFKDRKGEFYWYSAPSETLRVALTEYYQNAQYLGFQYMLGLANDDGAAACLTFEELNRYATSKGWYEPGSVNNNGGSAIRMKRDEVFLFAYHSAPADTEADGIPVLPPHGYPTYDVINSPHKYDCITSISFISVSLTDPSRR